MPLTLTDLACSWIKLACLLLHFDLAKEVTDSFINEPRLQHLNSALAAKCLQWNKTLHWSGTQPYAKGWTPPNYGCISRVWQLSSHSCSYHSILVQR